MSKGGLIAQLLDSKGLLEFLELLLANIIQVDKYLPAVNLERIFYGSVILGKDEACTDGLSIDVPAWNEWNWCIYLGLLGVTI